MRRSLYLPVFLAFLLITAGTLVWAQEEMSPLPAPEPQPVTQQAPKQTWTPDELDNLVAPIALYPDPLLGQMLVASTYPLEVVEASQWLQRNRNLSSRELINAAKQQPWDPSVQALVAVPDALEEVNRDIGWTTELGNAFLAQQAEVMSAVQHMRARAQANGSLHSTPQQTVRTEDEGGQQAIVIEPANPQVIYVPYYDPAYIWGPPVYGYYPPLYYPLGGFGFGPGFNLSFYFDNWGGWDYWGWGPNWFGGSVFVNNYFFPRYGFYDGYYGRFRGRTVWAHDPGHRFGVPYWNRRVSDRFERASIASRNSFRPGGRDFSAAQYRSSSATRFSGRTPEQRYRSTAMPRSSVPQQRNQAYQGYRGYQTQRNQAQQQYRPTVSQERYASQQQYRNTASQPRYTSQQQYRPAVQQYRNTAPQQRYSSQQQYRSTAPQQRYTSQQQYRNTASQPRYTSQQQYRPAVQQYRSTAPQQRYSSQQQYRSTAPQQRYSSRQQSRPAIQSSARSYSRGGSSSFSGNRGYARAGGSGNGGGRSGSSRGGGRRR